MVMTGYCGRRDIAEERGEGNQMFFFSGLEAQGEINRLLDRLFGSYD
jgi:hypothetical protein